GKDADHGVEAGGARLESAARGREIVERRARPRAAVTRDENASTARSAEDEARPHDLRRDQHTPGAAQVLLDPRLVRIAEEVAQGRARVRNELLGLRGRRWLRGARGD